MRDDDLLTDALARLPRARAASSFTARTLARLDAEPARRAFWLRPAWAFALLLAMATTAALVVGPWRAAERRAARAALVAEHGELARQLAALRSELEATRPTMALPGESGRATEVDPVELERFASDLRAGSTRGAGPLILPVSF